MEALRSLILEDLVWSTIWPGFLVVAVARRADAGAQRAADPQLRLSPDFPILAALAAVDSAPGRSAGTTKDPPCTVPGRSTINGAHDPESSTVDRRIRAENANSVLDRRQGADLVRDALCRHPVAGIV